MSAENMLEAVRMVNGQIWIVNRACGDTVAECYGQCGVVAKCDTYEEAEETFINMMDEDSDRYVYTEHGGEFPSREELERQTPCLLRSTVEVRFDRPCGCVDFRDLQKKRWSVVERWGWSDDSLRVIGNRLWYAQAITLAHAHATAQPGECTVQVPTHFRAFRRYHLHDCAEDHWSLCLPCEEK